MQQGKCSNFGNCDKADSREIITIPDGQEMKCPNCGHRLAPAFATGGRPSPVPLLIGIAVFALLVGGVYFLVQNVFGGKPSTTTTQNTTPSTTPINSTTTSPPPVAVGAGDVIVFCDLGAQAWMQKAADEFNKNHPGSRILPDYRGSREGKDTILYGKGQPIVWSPADTYWTDKLNLDWRSVGKHSDTIVDKSVVILKTKLVLVMSRENAEKFEAAMKGPKYNGKTWALMFDLATKGWSTIGMSGGKLKLSQSDPTKSNSGLAALALMYAEYDKAHSGATTSTVDFVHEMKEIESACNGIFTETTGKSLKAFLADRASYDMAICYEANAIKAINDGATDIRVVYPSPTMEANFPAATLKGDWITPQRADVARQFVDYLLTTDVQKAALDYGFRPAQELRTDVDTAFSAPKLKEIGLRADPYTTTSHYDTKVLEDLIFQWNSNVSHR